MGNWRSQGFPARKLHSEVGKRKAASSFTLLCQELCCQQGHSDTVPQGWRQGHQEGWDYRGRAQKRRRLEEEEEVRHINVLQMRNVTLAFLK